MINKKMITVKLNNSRFSSYDNLGFELKELEREISKQLKDKKVSKSNGDFDSPVIDNLIENLRTELTTLLNNAITDFTNRLDNFASQLVTTEHQLELLNGVTPFYSGEGVTVKKDGKIVTISGMINTVPDGEVTIANIPQMFRPRHNLVFVVALSGSTSGGYGTVVVKTNGDINVLYRSMKTKYICLNGISYDI